MSFLDFSHTADLCGAFGTVFIYVVSMFQFFRPVDSVDESTVVDSPTELVSKAPVSIGWNFRLKKGLNKSRSEVWGKLGQIFTGQGPDFDKLEEILYGADIGPQMVEEILTKSKDLLGKEKGNLESMKLILFEHLFQTMHPFQTKLDSSFPDSGSNNPHIIMVVGINGAGKTTTVGKLATRIGEQAKSVHVGACDTYRAAAVDQLEVWCQRSGASIKRAPEGRDPSSVAYEAVEEAISQKKDICLLDTAGRLHTNKNLMEELKKMKRVIQKLVPNGPHEILLVLDAITGQNALKQAKEFHDALGLTGLVFTKCDGSSKAGNAVSIVKDLQVPIRYIGVGEEAQDLNLFNTKDFLYSLLDIEAVENSLH